MSASPTETFDIKIEDRDLPVLAVVAKQTMKLVERTDVSARDLEDLIRMDPSLTVRILRLANSPIHGSSAKVNTVHQAVVRMGIIKLKSTLLEAATGEVFDHTDPYPRALWKHSVAVALTTRHIADNLRLGIPEEYFIAGLLHDIGKFIIYRQAPGPYGSIMDEAALKSIRFYKHERARINHCTHETVGALVQRKWGFSPEMIEVSRFHHDIEQNDEVAAECSLMVVLVSFANLLVNTLGYGAEAASTIDLAASSPARILGLSESKIDDLKIELPEIIQSSESVLG